MVRFFKKLLLVCMIFTNSGECSFLIEGVIYNARGHAVRNYIERNLSVKYFKGTTMVKRNYSTFNENSTKVERLSSESIDLYSHHGLIKFKTQSEKLPHIWPLHDHNKLHQEYKDHLKHILKRANVVGLGCKNYLETQGFIIGNFIFPPTVYNAGLTCLIDEFNIGQNGRMDTTGQVLLDALNNEARVRHASQLLVLNDSVYGQDLHGLLLSRKMSISSLWFCGYAKQPQDNNEYHIQRIQKEDVRAVVELSEIKRRAYEKVQPLFWKMAPNANEEQYNYLLKSVTNPTTLPYCIKEKEKIKGFIIGEILPTKPFYCTTKFCRIDDFMVTTPEDWKTIGHHLMAYTSKQASLQGANHLWVVSGAHDKPKLELMSNADLIKSSEWWTGSVF